MSSFKRILFILFVYVFLSIECQEKTEPKTNLSIQDGKLSSFKFFVKLIPLSLL